MSKCAERLLLCTPTVDDRGELDLDAKDCRIQNTSSGVAYSPPSSRNVRLGEAVRGPRRESGRNTTGHLDTASEGFDTRYGLTPKFRDSGEQAFGRSAGLGRAPLEEDIVAFEDTLAKKIWPLAGSECSAVSWARSLGGVTGRL